MTENEAAILAALADHDGQGWHGGWLTPRQFGGTSNSHHPTTAKRMTTKGWVEMEWRSGMKFRASFRYRITPLGLQALENHNLTKRLAQGAAETGQ